MATNTTRGEGQAGHDVSRQILLLNPANTPARHKTFEPNIYPNLGLLTLAATSPCRSACCSDVARVSRPRFG